MDHPALIERKLDLLIVVAPDPDASLVTAMLISRAEAGSLTESVKARSRCLI